MDAVTEFLLNHWYVAGPLALLCTSFVIWFLAPALALDRNLGAMTRALEALRADPAADPAELKIADAELARLWSQYCDTLQVDEPPEWKVLLGAAPVRRSTAPAEAFFCGTAAVDGRLHVEFFKHLPGLLTGLGIIGTFGGLIDGLGAANIGGALKTEFLIASVREAFFVSAGAIIAAMLVTFFEKFLYARLHRRISALHRQIDGLYASAGGDDFMPRLVRASEQAATHTGQLNENLVGELRDFLLRLVERQKELGERQDARLQQLVAMLQRPGEAASKKPERAPRAAADPAADAMREQMAEFAGAVSRAVAEQVAQARELQALIVKSLDAASQSSKELAQGIAAASERATAAMTDQMNRALHEMAWRQGQMNDALRSLIEELRGAAGGGPKDKAQPEARRLTSGEVLDLAETLAQIQTARAAE